MMGLRVKLSSLSLWIELSSLIIMVSEVLSFKTMGNKISYFHWIKIQRIKDDQSRYTILSNHAPKRIWVIASSIKIIILELA